MPKSVEQDRDDIEVKIYIQTLSITILFTLRNCGTKNVGIELCIFAFTFISCLRTSAPSLYKKSTNSLIRFFQTLYMTGLFMYFSSLEVNSSCTEGAVRLAGGETVMEGRVEVCHSHTWWAIHGSLRWDYWDAMVVCRQLHYPSNCKYPNNEYSNKTMSNNSKIVNVASI